MPPFFCSQGYLLAVLLLCAVWACVIDAVRLRLGGHLLLYVTGLSALGAASILGLATFLKSGRSVAAYVGTAICGCSILIWLYAIAADGDGRIAAPCALLVGFGGLGALHRSLMHSEERKLAARATGLLLIASAFALVRGMLLLAGVAACCLLLSYRIFRVWRTRAAQVRGNLGELLVTVALISVALAAPAGVYRAARPPLYSKDAIFLPLDQWKGSLAVHLLDYDVWIEYPKARLSERQRTWFSTPHMDEHFYQQLGADLRPRVTALGRRGRQLYHKVAFTSDTREWVGEYLGFVLAGASEESTLYLDEEAARKLGQIGARLVVDLPTHERVTRGQDMFRSVTKPPKVGR